MPRVAVEELVPYRESLIWRIHDAYFGQRGSAAWTQGEVPCLATSNFGIAVQHGLLLVELVRELEERGALGPDEPVEVLEVGGGVGLFASNLLRALATGCGRRGRELSGRLRYVFSDYSRVTVEQAVGAVGLEAAVEEGRVVPALLDLRTPERLTDLAGKPLRPRLCVVFANYVSSVLPVTTIQRREDGSFHEAFVRAYVEAEDGVSLPDGETLARELLSQALAPEVMDRVKLETEWRPEELERLVPDAFHREVVLDLLSDFSEASFAYPHAWLDAVRAFRGMAREGGIVLVNDYGTTERRSLEGLRAIQPEHFGNSIAHAVNTAIIEAFCRCAGFAHVDTADPLRSVHTSATIFGKEASPSFRRAFRASYIDRTDGADLVELSSVARERLRSGDPRAAARLYQRCLRIDPRNDELLYHTGVAALEGGYPSRALELLRKARRLDATGRLNVDFQLGRALFELREFKKAIRCYRRALTRASDAATHTNMGVAYAALGELDAAWRCCEAALTLDPAYQKATGLQHAIVELRAAQRRAEAATP